MTALYLIGSLITIKNHSKRTTSNTLQQNYLLKISTMPLKLGKVDHGTRDTTLTISVNMSYRIE